MEDKVKCNRSRVPAHTIVSFVVVMLVFSFLFLTGFVMILFREYSSLKLHTDALQERVASLETKLKTKNSTKLNRVDPSETQARSEEVRSCKIMIINLYFVL